jgi:hypothetical protein
MTDPGHTHTPPPPGEKKYWLDDMRNVQKVFWWVILVCVALTLAEFFYHQHPALGFDGEFNFYGFYGFFACVALVLAAKELRKILMRREDYYDDATTDAATDGEDDG